MLEFSKMDFPWDAHNYLCLMDKTLEIVIHLTKESNGFSYKLS